MYDVIVIGMGISGITAGIYAHRAGKKVLLLDKGMPGGLLNSIDVISNYPGLIDVKGIDFAHVLESQVKSMNIEYKLEEVIGLDLTEYLKQVTTKNGVYSSKKVILAMGRSPKYLGLDDEDKLLGKGLSTCATCDANFYKGKDIAVVGTGNSALSECLYLSNIVNHIYLINRRDAFRGEEILVEQIKNNPNIEIIYNANITKYNEENDKLSSVTLDNGTTLNVSGVFIYVGYKPCTSFVDSSILDNDGYVVVNEKLESSIPGVYAIGDIIRKDTYQLTTAAADGTRVIYNMKW